MSKKNKDPVDPDDPKPLNFDEAEEHGVSDHLKRPYQTPEDERGDNEDDQYYEMEEGLSPEEVAKRKAEGRKFGENVSDEEEEDVSDEDDYL